MAIYALIGGGVAVFLFLIWLAFGYAKKAGQAAAERDQFKRKSEQARIANAIDEDVGRLSDDDLDRELRGG